MNRIKIRIEGDTAGGINAIGHHILTMIRELGWSYRARLPFVEGPTGFPQAYGAHAAARDAADLHVDIDTLVAVEPEPTDSEGE